MREGVRGTARQLVMSALIVVGMVAAPIGVSPVGAAHAAPGCDAGTAAEYAVVGGAAVLNPTSGVEESWGNSYDKCFGGQDNELYNDLSQIDAKQTKDDLYAGALEQRAIYETTFTRIDNYLNDTDAAAWSQAEMAIANAHADGLSAAAAASRANESVDRYYSVKQRNLIADWNAAVAAAETAKETADQEANVSNQFVEEFHDSAAGTDFWDWKHRVKSFGNKSITLVNGSSVDVRTITFEVKDGSADTWSVPASIDTGNVNSADDGETSPSNVEATFSGIHVTNPNGDGTAEIVDLSEWNHRYSRFEQQATDIKTESAAYTERVYNGLEAGTVNSTEIISRNTEMFDMISDPSENSSLARRTFALSGLGLETPKLNGTGTMEVTYQGTEYNGLVAAESAPDGGWQANTTYNASNMPGMQILATTDGEQVMLDGEFTLGTITNESGGAIDTIEHKKTVYKTNNVSELNAKLDEILDSRLQVEKRERELAGGGGFNLGGIGDFWNGLGIMGKMAVVIGGIGVVVLLRD